MSTKPEASGHHLPSSIRLTTRHERSLYMLLIHLVVRPFRNHLGRPKKQQPKGSLELKPQGGASKKCDIKHRTVCDINVYDMISKTPSEADKRKRIYYFSGGGWQSPPSSQHWSVCAQMARDVPGTTVTLVSYPLAPNNAAPIAFPLLLQFYREIMRIADQEGEEVMLAGDSSGGNIVLSLILEALHEDEQLGPEQKHPSHPVAIFAICPSTDLTRNNPDIEKLAKDDPLLTPKFVKQTANAWYGDWDPADRRVTPINADISLLKKNGVHVHGITAGYDILSPDGIIFRKKLAEVGVEGEWLHWERQMHCFVLTAAYGLSEAKEAVDWMMGVLSKE